MPAVDDDTEGYVVEPTNSRASSVPWLEVVGGVPLKFRDWVLLLLVFLFLSRSAEVADFELLLVFFE